MQPPSFVNPIALLMKLRACSLLPRPRVKTPSLLEEWSGRRVNNGLRAGLWSTWSIDLSPIGLVPSFFITRSLSASRGSKPGTVSGGIVTKRCSPFTENLDPVPRKLMIFHGGANMVERNSMLENQHNSKTSRGIKNRHLQRNH